MKFLSFYCLLLANYASAQSIVNFAFVDSNNKITENKSKIKYLILIKKYSDSSFQRVDYKIDGPRISAVFYKDPELTIKQGTTRIYTDSGNVAIVGTYKLNNKTGKWYNYNTKKIEIYEANVMVSEKSLSDTSNRSDTVGRLNPNRPGKEEIESEFQGGMKAYKKFLNKNTKYPDRAMNLKKEGNVVLQFAVDSVGMAIDADIVKSVEFSLDEEALRLVTVMPKWLPARLDGRCVKSYKKQPINFSFH